MKYIFIEKKYIFFFEIIACDPSIHTIDQSDFLVCSFMENSICPSSDRSKHIPALLTVNSEIFARVLFS